MEDSPPEKLIRPVVVEKLDTAIHLCIPWLSMKNHYAQVPRPRSLSLAGYIPAQYITVFERASKHDHAEIMRVLKVAGSEERTKDTDEEKSVLSFCLP